MAREYGEDGYLVYSFADIVKTMHPYYVMRLSGGAIYFAGALIMAWNVYKTIRGDLRAEQPLYAPKYNADADRPVVEAAKA